VPPGQPHPRIRGYRGARIFDGRTTPRRTRKPAHGKRSLTNQDGQPFFSTVPPAAAARFEGAARSLPPFARHRRTRASRRRAKFSGGGGPKIELSRVASFGFPSTAGVVLAGRTRTRGCSALSPDGAGPPPRTAAEHPTVLDLPEYPDVRRLATPSQSRAVADSTEPGRTTVSSCCTFFSIPTRSRTMRQLVSADRQLRPSRPSRFADACGGGQPLTALPVLTARHNPETEPSRRGDRRPPRTTPATLVPAGSPP